jgi:hypothetical protein
MWADTELQPRGIEVWVGGLRSSIILFLGLFYHPNLLPRESLVLIVLFIVSLYLSSTLILFLTSCSQSV